MKKNKWILVAIILGSIVLIILFTILLWIIFVNLYVVLFSKIDSKIASELGGFIAGFIGIFWTAAGVILIYVTFNEQRKLSEKQQFESAFFNLISTYHNIVSNTKGIVLGRERIGRGLFSYVLRDLKHNIGLDQFYESICENDSIPEIKSFLKQCGIDKNSNTSVKDPKLEIRNHIETIELPPHSEEFIIALYEFIYKKHHSNLGHYFSFIYNIFKFTIEERAKYGDEKRYINLIQAQMSNDELALLFYNALSKYGKKSTGESTFYNWLNEYSFFENLDENSLIDRSHHKYYLTLFKFLNDEEKKEKHKYSKLNQFTDISFQSKKNIENSTLKKEDKMAINISDRYKLIFEEHHFASNFRIKIIQGWCLIYSALGAAFIWVQSEPKEISWIISLAACLVTILMWIADIRNRSGLIASKRAGNAIEISEDANIPIEQRFFARIQTKEKLINKLTQSLAIDIFAIIMIISLIIATILLIANKGNI